MDAHNSSKERDGFWETYRACGCQLWVLLFDISQFFLLTTSMVEGHNPLKTVPEGKNEGQS
jgi:hypothetical protein